MTQPQETWDPHWKARKTAHAAVQQALADGTLTRPPECSVCKKPCVPHGHHEDYSKPLEVDWLCRSCHTDWHKKHPQPITERVRLLLGRKRGAGSKTKIKTVKCRLTKREDEVFKLICIGLQNDDIARNLELSCRTVETHRERIYRFASVSNAAQLIGWGLKNKLLTVKMLTA